MNHNPDKLDIDFLVTSDFRQFHTVVSSIENNTTKIDSVVFEGTLVDMDLEARIANIEETLIYNRIDRLEDRIATIQEILDINRIDRSGSVKHHC
jgi:uncharacterized membrane protein